MQNFTEQTGRADAVIGVGKRRAAPIRLRDFSMGLNRDRQVASVRQRNRRAPPKPLSGMRLAQAAFALRSFAGAV
jgi:hypothetical protein